MNGFAIGVARSFPLIRLGTGPMLDDPRQFVKLTADDAAIMKARVKRAQLRAPPPHAFWIGSYWRQVAGYSIGWGFEADYLDSLSRLDCLRLRAWLEHNAT